LLCTSFQFRCLFRFFFFCRGVHFCLEVGFCPGGLSGVAEGYCVMLGAHLFGLLNVSQARLSWWWPTCSLSVWHGEAFHGLGIQGSKVSTLPCASPPPSMTPASLQAPWFTELTLSASVPQSPSWILF
jgi:hypothetical protein